MPRRYSRMRVEPSQFVEHRNKHRPREVSFGKRKAKDSNCKARAVGLPLLQEPRTAVRQLWRGMMKALFAALALVTLLASPTFATVRPVAATAGDQAPPAMVRIHNAAWARTSGSSPRDGSICGRPGAGRRALWEGIRIMALAAASLLASPAFAGWPNLVGPVPKSG